MSFFNCFRLAKASTPLFLSYSYRNYWPLTPWALAAMLEQLEQPGRRSKLQLSGIQLGCSVLLCDEAQQCQWFTLVIELSGKCTANEVALLSPLGMALTGKNVGDEVRWCIAGKQCTSIVIDIIRVRHQPGQSIK